MIFLSDRSQRVIRLRYGKRKTIREISDELKISPSYVRKIIKKSLLCMYSVSIKETKTLEKLQDKLNSNIYSIGLKLNTMSPITSHVIKMKYGLYGGCCLNDEEISSILGIDKEFIHIIEKDFFDEQVLKN